MSHKSSSIFSVVMAERDESLTNPPLHLIHMSICLLSMPLSKDYWCPAFDLWHILCHNVSSNELNQRREKKTCLPSVPRIGHNSFICVRPCWYCDCEYYGSSGAPVKCYLTSAGLCIVLSGVCHLTCHPHKKFWILIWVGGLIIQQISNCVTLKSMDKVISFYVFFLSLSQTDDILVHYLSIEWFTVQ